MTPGSPASKEGDVYLDDALDRIADDLTPSEIELARALLAMEGRRLEDGAPWSRWAHILEYILQLRVRKP